MQMVQVFADDNTTICGIYIIYLHYHAILLEVPQKTERFQFVSICKNPFRAKLRASHLKFPKLLFKTICIVNIIKNMSLLLFV